MKRKRCKSDSRSLRASDEVGREYIVSEKLFFSECGQLARERCIETNGGRLSSSSNGGQAMDEPLSTLDIPKVDVSDASPLLLTGAEAAAMLGATARTWRTWDAMGKIPQAIRIGRKPFWRPEELKVWVAAGCPDRETWEIMRQ
jgi:hypothetical protein